MLVLGFVLSITGVFGIGSLVAFIIGWKALRSINDAQHQISGRFIAWWCIVLGAIGTLIWPPAVIISVLNAPNDL